MDVRPLLLAEPLLKRASTAVYASEMNKILPIFAAAEQHALGTASAAPGMLLEARATMASQPAASVLSGDVKNAFGSVLRRVMLAAVLWYCPNMAPMLLALRGSRTVIHQRIGESFTITDGLWQGDMWSAACFALAMLEIRKEVLSDVEKQDLCSFVRFNAYLDDLLVFVSAAGIAGLIRCLSRVLAAAGLELELSKSSVLVGSEPLQESIRESLVAAGIAFADGSLEVLGSELHDAEASVLSSTDSVVPAPVQRRLDSALEMCDRLGGMMKAEVDRPPCPAVWATLRTSINNCLSFDLAVVSPCVLDAILKKLDAAVETVFCVLVHTERLSPAERCQIQLHVSRGGFGLPSFRRRAAVVYASTTLRLLPLLARRATTDPEWVAWERSAATMQCMQYIHEQWGLALDAQMNLVPMAAVPEWDAILHAVH